VFLTEFCKSKSSNEKVILQVRIYKHISDIRNVTSVNNGENYANLISTSAYHRRATIETSKEDGADRWSL
jgi:hypothetical protein